MGTNIFDPVGVVCFGQIDSLRPSILRWDWDDAFEEWLPSCRILQCHKEVSQTLKLMALSASVRIFHFYQLVQGLDAHEFHVLHGDAVSQMLGEVSA